MPGRLEGAAADGPYRLGDWEKDHPIFALFDDPLHGDLRTLRFRRITRIVPDAPSRVLVTARGLRPRGGETSWCGQVPAVRDSGRQRMGGVGHRSPLSCRWSINWRAIATNRLPELGSVTSGRRRPGPEGSPRSRHRKRAGRGPER